MRKIEYILLAGFLLLVCAATTITLVRHSASVHKPAAGMALAEHSDETLIQRLQDENVAAFYRWEVSDDMELLCLVRAFNTHPNWVGPGVRLSIHDKKDGEVIYESLSEQVLSISSSHALRNGQSQLIIETDGGGTSTFFLQILDYQNGKISELLNTKDNDFNVGATVRPSFRSGIVPAKEPFQIYLTRGVGLVSPVEKYTSVYRYKDGSYQFVGEYSQQKADDCIEHLMKNNYQKK